MGILKDEVVTGKEEKPATILAHGHPGTGKSTFASSLGKVIAASKDGGLSEIDCAKVPMEGQGTAKLVDLMRELATENHKYDTFCIDGFEHCEADAIKEVCQANSVENLNDVPYGKAYAQVRVKLQDLLAMLKELRDHKKMQIILTTQTIAKEISEPHLDPYHQYHALLGTKAAIDTYAWADAVLFFQIKTVIDKVDKGFGQKESKSVTRGERVITTGPAGGIFAKNRYGLPTEMPADAKQFLQAIKQSRQDKENK